MKKSLLLLSVMAAMFTGCAQNQICVGNSYASNGQCEEALAKRIGIIKEIKENTMIVSLEDNSVVEVPKQNDILKIGDQVNIFVKK